MKTRRRIRSIAFVSPRRPLWSRTPRIAECFKRNAEALRPWYSPPLSLLTVAALTPGDIQISFVDEDFDDVDYTQSYDLVAISAMTQQALRAYEIADEFRKRGIPVVMGGIHATVLPEEALEHVNTVVVGEAEETWGRCLDDYENGTPARAYKNPPGHHCDLSRSVPPRYDLLSPDHIAKRSTFFNMISIQATRGCPHDCNFCVVSKIYGRRIRKKSVSQIMVEIEGAKALAGNPLLMFADDNLFVDRRFAKELLAE